MKWDDDWDNWSTNWGGLRCEQTRNHLCICPRHGAHFPHDSEPDTFNKDLFSGRFPGRTSILGLKYDAVCAYQLFGQAKTVNIGYYFCISLHSPHRALCTMWTVYISSILASRATLTSILLLRPCSQMINPLLKRALQKWSGRQILTLKLVQLKFDQRGKATRDVLNMFSECLYSSTCWQNHAGTHMVNVLTEKLKNCHFSQTPN